MPDRPFPPYEHYESIRITIPYLPVSTLGMMDLAYGAHGQVEYPGVMRFVRDGGQRVHSGQGDPRKVWPR